MNKKQLILLLSVIILAGTFLRFYKIGSQSFWLDEAATALSIKKYSPSETFHNTVVLGQILPEYYNSNLDLPPYYVALKLWSNIFGVNETSLRSFSAIFGILSIIVVYLLSEELFNKKTGIIASLIFSLNVVMIEYSQEARLYSTLIFIVLLSAYFFIKLLRTNKSMYAAGFVASNVAGMYIHHPFLFFVIFELFFIFILFMELYLKSGKIKIIKIQIATLALMAAYIPLAYRLLKPKFVATHYIGKFSFGNIIKLFVQMNTWIYPSEQLSTKINTMDFHSFLFLDWTLIISAIVITFLLAIFFLKNFSNKKMDENKLFLLLWLAIPALIGFFVLYKSIITFGTLRYFIFIVPAYLILAANQISKLEGKKLAILILLIILLSVPQIVSYYSNPSKPQYSDMVRFLETKSEGKDLVIVNLPSVAVPFDYYSDKLENVYGAGNVDDAKKISSNAGNLWLVLSTKYSDPDGKIKSYFNSNYKLLESANFHDVYAYHYAK